MHIGFPFRVDGGGRAAVESEQDHIRHLIERFDGNLVFAVAAYNAGPGNVDKWVQAYDDNTGDIDTFIESIPFEETREYVKRVLRSYAAYKMLYQRR